ncbi:MAG: 30S ribosomal protein S5 [Candidatus Aenigmarchaeota archaeon]|nr:30S ribosomal protein S5 [Candidatus Aenigmarchaeota archaeon]
MEKSEEKNKTESEPNNTTSEESMEKVPVVVMVTPEEAPEVIAQVPVVEEPQPESSWKPKTILGKRVLEGKIKNIDEIFSSGSKIVEYQIVDHLVPALQSELILIGGRGGKGGGIQRIPIRITAKMHGSGRRFSTSALFVVGDGNGILGVGRGASVEPRTSMEKSLRKAKLSVIKIKRGCGDWECGCGTEHSIAFKTKGHSGSVRVELMPAPKGVGLVADNETKKLLRLAGIKDVWIKTFGNTSNRVNLILAVFDALKNLYVYEK